MCSIYCCVRRDGSQPLNVFACPAWGLVRSSSKPERPQPQSSWIMMTSALFEAYFGHTQTTHRHAKALKARFCTAFIANMFWQIVWAFFFIVFNFHVYFLLITIFLFLIFIAFNFYSCFSYFGTIYQSFSPTLLLFFFLSSLLFFNIIIIIIIINFLN